MHDCDVRNNQWDEQHCASSRIPHLIRSCNESKLSTELLKAVKRVEYKTPSPVLMAAIPLGLQQYDVIGVAETGSGNTAVVVMAVRHPPENLLRRPPRRNGRVYFQVYSIYLPSQVKFASTVINKLRHQA